MDFNNGAPLQKHLYQSNSSADLVLDLESRPLEYPRIPYANYRPQTPPQIISSLIDSLSKISASAQSASRADLAAENSTIHIPQELYSRPTSSEPPDADALDRDVHDPVIADDSSEGEVAAAPVIRYARRPPILSKRSSRSLIHSVSMSQPGLAPRDSLQSLKSRAESDSVGIPSIERLDRSSASSTFSIISGLSVAPRRKPTTESIHDLSSARPIPKRVSSDRRRKTESLYSMEQEKENKYPTRASSIDGYSTSGTQLDTSGVDSPTAAALSRLSRGEIGTHMIPSRRSSLRRSATGLSDASQESNNRYSFSGRNLKDLNIDVDLIEGDDSTVRRIRELQEAREKRQREWRNEARKSERAAKRHTIATPKLSQRASPYPSSRLSVTEVVVESPEVESPPELSATLTAADLASMPAIVPDPPKDDSQAPHSAKKPPATNPNSAANSRRNSLYRNPSSQAKRTSTTYSIKQEPALAELKSITDDVDSFLSAPRFTQKIRHPRTGRTIVFSEVGDPKGFVVLCCVGMGLTRYLTAFYDELARTMRLRLITPDRPGVGESSPVPEASCTPLNWVDDVAVICNSLEITRFSLLAHSAGAVYALATALKMPQYVRGRIHLLAPWIPPSQMPKGAALGPDSQPIANLPLTHKILSVLPTQILKVANSRFLTATSASVDTKPLKPSKKNKYSEKFEASLDYSFNDLSEDVVLSNAISDFEPERPRTGTPNRARSVSCYQATNDSLGIQVAPAKVSTIDSRRQTEYFSKQSSTVFRPVSPRLSPEARQAIYNKTLTHRIWALATQNANPAIDLVVCLERRRSIGFRYPEVTRSVVIHHGAKDTRVPLDNVRWLQSMMKRCELRVLHAEGHGLMASASAMATVLGEIGREWEEWEKIALGKDKRKKDDSSSPFSRGKSFHHRFADGP